MDKKTRALDAITTKIEMCKQCKEDTSGLPVPGEGNPEATLMFVGEAPGYQESITGKPFIGRAGKLLTRLLTEISIDRKDVYITSPVKYFPGRRTPKPAEIAHGKTHLIEQIAVIEPKLIVLLGNSAIRAVLPKPLPVSNHHGTVTEQNGIRYFITFHPAAAVRFPNKFLPLLREDFRKLATMIGSKGKNT